MKNSHIAALLVGGAALAIVGGYIQIPQAIAPAGVGQIAPDVGVGTCPTDGDSTVTITLVNGEDEAAGSFDAAGYFLTSDGKVAVTVADTTAGTATLNCGEEYVFKLVASNSDGGDNSEITAASANGGTVHLEDGGVRVKATRGNMAINLVGSIHGVVEARLFSNTNNAYFYDTGDAATTDYEVDGTTFISTTDNATETAVGSGGQFEATLEYRATSAVRDASDFGYWVMLDAIPATWQEPSCYLDGVKLTNSKGSFTSKESQQFSGYEYAYKVDGKIIDDLHYIRCNFKALAGVNPATGGTDDLQVDMVAIGNTLANDGVSIQRGAADDDSSATVTYTVQDFTIDVS